MAADRDINRAVELTTTLLVATDNNLRGRSIFDGAGVVRTMHTDHAELFRQVESAASLAVCPSWPWSVPMIR